MLLRPIFAAALLLATITSVPVYAANDFINPETSTRSVVRENKTAVHGKRFMISAANPLAVEAGAQILREGGSAIDAALATQLVLNVVEPQSSGIGGGGFMLYWDAAEKQLRVYDGRETAPTDVDSHLFLDEKGAPIPFADAIQGGRPVGAPGLLKMLELAHKKHGHVEWSRLFVEAMRLSRDGFPMSPRLHDLLTTTAHIKQFPASMRPFINDDNTVKNVGELVINQELYETFSLLARKGTAPFYQGELAHEIVKTVQQSPVHPGSLSLVDLKTYQVKEREPVCAPYRQYTICSMPPPSSGGVTILQALAIINHLTAADIRKVEPLSVDAAHIFAEASKLAYADRNRYLADPDFVTVPTKAMLNPDYLAHRSKLVSADNTMLPALPGQFAKEQDVATILTTEEHPSTTHISVIDANGNAVALTTSIEQGFGSGLSARGFLLNNQLTDFSFLPTLPDGKTLHPNRVEPNKRPRSSMSPTMVFENGKLVMVIGSPGGARIIEYVLQTLIAVLDWNMDIQQAINLPHYVNMNGPTELESGTEAVKLQEGLTKRGHVVKIMEAPSGLHGITRFGNALKGGADPRREGIAIGE